MKKIGFIGLGIMGRHMALNLLKAGYEIICHDINKEPVMELVSKGAKEGDSPKEVAENSEIIITMLPDSPDVKKVVLGENGIIEGIKRGAVYIDMSSIDPIVSRQICKDIEAKGAQMIDAPVSGGEPRAVDATLSIMAGGKQEVFESIKDILSVMGGSVVLVGEIGSGNVAKLANQIMVALNIAAASEALMLAKKAGVDPENVFKAVRGGLAGSNALDAKAPLILAGDFKPGFRIELHIKDLMNALSAAHEVGSPLPLTSQVLEILYNLKADGCAKDDHGGIVKYYEKLSGTEVRK